MKKVRFQKKNHIVYDTVQEAQEAGIEVFEGDWRKAEAGDWVRSDQDPPEVIQVLARGAWWLRTCCGTFATNRPKSCHSEGNRLTAIPRNYRWSITGKRHGKGKTISAKMRAMVPFFCHGETAGDLKATFLKVYKRLPGPNEWAMYSYSPKFWEAVGMELKQEMDERGLTRDFLIGKMKKALDTKEIEATDLFKMAKEALELHEGQKKQKGRMALFGNFRVEDTPFEEVEKKEIGDGKET